MLYIATILIIIAVANLVVGGVIFARKRQEAANQYFLLLTIGVALWSAGVGLYLITPDTFRAYIYSNTYYLAALLIAVSLYMFARVQRLPASRWDYLHLAVPLGYGVMAIVNPETLVSFKSTDLFNVAIQQPNYLIYSLIFSAYFIWAAIQLALSAYQASQRRRRQLGLVAAGVVLAGMVGVSFNLWLPATGEYRLIWVGPLFSLVFLLTTAYAVVRYKLFDLRSALARALAYLMALFFVIIVYALGLAVVGQNLFTENKTTQAQNMVYIGLAVLLVFTFQPLKNFFDRITNRLFFNRSYEPERIIQEFGDAMLGSIRLENLASATFMVLDRTFAPQHLAMIVDDERSNRHYIRAHGVGASLSKPEIRSISAALDKPRYRRLAVIDGEELDGEADKELRGLLEERSVAVIIRIDVPQRGSGYLMLGYRQNGAGYGSTDMYVLRTIGDELALAVENSLQFDQINAFNQTLQHRIDEATSELRRSNQRLHKLDKTKDEFISMASHQLRTPLTTIKGYISMVLDGDAGDVNAPQRKLLEEAFNSSQRMVYLINDFLNVSRLQTGKFVLEKQPVDIGVVLQQEIEQLRMIAKTRQLNINYQSPKDIPQLEIDENKIRQVMMNFVDNAIYYSPAGEDIAVSLEKAKDRVVFKVTDKGIGVPASEQAELFTKFYRASNARKQRPDGTGVGLYMAKKVVIGHGGSVIFNSQEGKGSTFGFSLPL